MSSIQPAKTRYIHIQRFSFWEHMPKKLRKKPVLSKSVQKQNNLLTIIKHKTLYFMALSHKETMSILVICMILVQAASSKSLKLFWQPSRVHSSIIIVQYDCSSFSSVSSMLRAYGAATEKAVTNSSTCPHRMGKKQTGREKTESK